MNNIEKIGYVEQLELIPADEFADVSEVELAEWINTGHVAIKMAVRRLAIHVAQVGAWLVAAKDKCQHGEWLPWLAENCPEIAERTTRMYKEHYTKMMALSPAKRQIIADLPVMQSYRALGIVKDPTDPEPVVTPPLPDGEYRCVVIDPPWPMQKINRDIIPYEEKLCELVESHSWLNHAVGKLKNLLNQTVNKYVAQTLCPILKNIPYVFNKHYPKCDTTSTTNNNKKQSPPIIAKNNAKIIHYRVFYII